MENDQEKHPRLNSIRRVILSGERRGMVGATGIEPATARPPAVCATRLRHAPIDTFQMLCIRQSSSKSFAFVPEGLARDRTRQFFSTNAGSL